MSGLERMLTGLLSASHLAPIEELPGLVREHAKAIGLTEVLIYLCDLRQEVLRLLTGRGPAAVDDPGADPAELSIDSTLAGRAFQQVRVLPRPEDENREDPECWWIPLLNGTARLGVLRVRSDGGLFDVETARHLASMVALLVSSATSFSDSYARLIRSHPMHVAAEMQWRLAPPLTFACDRVTVSAVMEPAYEVAGDTFDYAIAGDVLHLDVFDAMGHDISAGLTASLAMAACRNHRRQGVGLADNSVAIEQVLTAEFGRDRFVTAIMGDLDLSSGMFTWVNRGHYPPVVIRDGRWVISLECPPAHPMGLSLGLDVQVCQEQLQPGDRLLLYTDGITEARDSAGREFGLQRFTDFISRHHSNALPVPETLRRLIHDVWAYQQGRFSDDATVLLAEWHPGGGSSGLF
ncbi:serine/threonine-protein phosphatase [Streptosporangiaceae bacterium NEAU-GS5]|nr:serine/threonine-protein phosphatase [Streptosporangiaceae bacterium NEAU-GS5]